MTLRQIVAPIWGDLISRWLFNRRKRFYGQFLNPGDLCFDVGANIGNRTEIFLGLKANVVSVEPQPDCVAKLQKRFSDRIKLVAKGLGAEEGILTMHINESSTLSSFSTDWIEKVKEDRFANYAWHKTIDVPITTLDNLIAEFGTPRFCKIDVEGFELEVLKGLTQPIPYISFEYAIPENQDNLLEIINLLVERNSSVAFNYSALEEMRYALPDFIEVSEFREMIQSEQFIATRFGDVYVRQ